MPSTSSQGQNEGESKKIQQPLERQVDNLEQEARMVLPGIQALFGFQLIAVFNQGFKNSLSGNEQIIHLLALLLIAASAALVMAPAAYHREANHQISIHFIKISSRYLAAAMWPLAAGICLDTYLIARVITESIAASLAISLVTFAFYSWNWFIFPRVALSRAHRTRHENFAGDPTPT